MEIVEYINHQKEIYEHILSFIDDQYQPEETFMSLVTFFDQNNFTKRDELENLFTMLFQIIENHHRNSDFFTRICQIIQYHTKAIKSIFTNKEIFNIFQYSQQILLFLFRQQILLPDEFCLTQILLKCDSNGSKFSNKFRRKPSNR